ncbi:hypothetical protein LCGC14_2232670 [marine sediment metagenome]|uniref:Uncharacterized protein n=1 Tax=marine sediment metagenome TaxID=412755 RepID=A0A0F9D7I1_9ZZZZ
MGVYSDGVRRLLPTWEPTESFPLCPDAVPMTKAETIHRRQEARVLHSPQTRCLYLKVPESELLYGGSPGGGMTDLIMGDL